MNASAEKQVKRGVVAAAAVNHPVFVFYDMFKKSAPPLSSPPSDHQKGPTEPPAGPVPGEETGCSSDPAGRPQCQGGESQPPEAFKHPLGLIFTVNISNA